MHNNTNIVEVDGVEIDVEKANRLLIQIIIKEKNNLKTKQFNMVKEIQRMIEEEVKCYSNP